jgi:hypothetical protein
MKLIQLIAAIAVMASIASPVSAQEPAQAVVSSGVTGFARHNDHVRDTTEFLALEYRGARDLYRGIKPLAGAFATSNGAAYVHAGVYRDFQLSSRWILAAHFSAGAFALRDGMDLGEVLEFQTGFDLSYRMDNGWRAGATLRHISNAGLADTNPGTESLGLLLVLPMH